MDRVSLAIATALVLAGVLGTPPAASAHPDIATVIVQFDARIRASASDPDLLVQRGELHRLAGHFEAASSDFDRAEELDASLPTVHYHRAWLRFDEERYAEALLALDRFLEANPESARGHAMRAQILDAQGQMNQAADAYARALQIHPDRVDWYARRAKALVAAGRLDAARSALEAGIEHLSVAVSLELAALELDLLLQDSGSALARLDRLRAQTRRPEQWLVRRAAVLSQVDRREEAIDALEAALAAIRDLPLARRRTSATLALADEARAMLEQLQR